ncbi:hypothetical protein ACVW0Y_003546 [Pseudomonas sp. TE3786]
MAIHYLASQENVACGRTGASLTSTQDVTQVSCKLCLRTVEKDAAEPVRKTPSLAELRAAAKAAKAAQAPVEQAPMEQAPAKQLPVAQAPAAKASVAVSNAAATQSSRAEWQQRLAQLPGKNRLPRGIARQAFI